MFFTDELETRSSVLDVRLQYLVEFVKVFLQRNLVRVQPGPRDAAARQPPDPVPHERHAS